MKLDLDALQKLLDPLGLLIMHYKTGMLWKYIVYTCDMQIVFDERCRILSANDIEALWASVIDASALFTATKKIMCNPYFNCKRLEEAIIKKDLIA